MTQCNELTLLQSQILVQASMETHDLQEKWSHILKYIQCARWGTSGSRGRGAHTFWIRLFSPSGGGGGGTPLLPIGGVPPSQVRMGRGTPTSGQDGGGYPIPGQNRCGWGGTPHPRSRQGYPFLLWCTPIPHQGGGTPIPGQVPGWDRGYSILTWDGGTPHQQDGGIPLSAEWGYPPSRSQVRMGGGYPTRTA